MNIQIGDNNNDEYNHQLMEYMSNEIDRKLNPHKYEVKKVKEHDGSNVMVGYIMMIVFIIVVAFNLIV